MEYKEPSVLLDLMKKSAKAAMFGFVVMKIQPMYDIHMNDSE